MKSIKCIAAGAHFQPEFNWFLANSILEDVEIDEVPYKFCAATVGNPHCVIPLNEISQEMAFLSLIDSGVVDSTARNEEFLGYSGNV